MKTGLHFLVKKLVLNTRIIAPISTKQPQFLVVGAQKSGTSSFYSDLLRHSKIAGALEKEVHYFDNQYERGDSWYRAHFNWDMDPTVITGEATPYYMFHPDAASRIRDCLPDVKLIFLLRDPTERAISHYFHEVRAGREQHSFAKAFELEVKNNRASVSSSGHQRFSYLARGKYLEQIERFLQYYDRSAMLILNSHYYFETPERLLPQVENFLDIPSENIGKYSKTKNIGRYTIDDTNCLPLLHEYFAPFNKRLFAFLGEDWGWPT